MEVSAQFKARVAERFDHRCPISRIDHPSLLTVPHILGRADNHELAEDIENVVLLDWTHHMAFDTGLWTFDESGRLWVQPWFETERCSLQRSLTSRRGEKFDALARVKDEYIEQHNDVLDWWPPQ